MNSNTLPNEVLDSMTATVKPDGCVVLSFDEGSGQHRDLSLQEATLIQYSLQRLFSANPD